jgi:hypothetical protein
MTGDKCTQALLERLNLDHKDQMYLRRDDSEMYVTTEFFRITSLRETLTCEFLYHFARFLSLTDAAVTAIDVRYVQVNYGGPRWRSIYERCLVVMETSNRSAAWLRGATYLMVRVLNELTKQATSVCV